MSKNMNLTPEFPDDSYLCEQQPASMPQKSNPKQDFEPKFISAADVAKELSVSRATAYRIIKELNEQLKAKGFITVPGKISRRYFMEKVYA